MYKIERDRFILPKVVKHVCNVRRLVRERVSTHEVYLLSTRETARDPW
jgi:hypothetical protein